MNNLHRELAPVSDAAWAEIEDEAKRSFTLYLAGRRVTDVNGPGGPTLAAVGTGHLAAIDPPPASPSPSAGGVIARVRQAQPLVELRVPFTLSRDAIDDVERGAQDPDWRPVTDAARDMAFAEDRAVFGGYRAAGITGIGESSPNPVMSLPEDVRRYPDTVAAALATLRQAGVGGPYALLLSDAAYTAVIETSDHGYPVRDQVSGVTGGEIVRASAIDGAYVVSTRGGDFGLHLGQDLSIGYLSHDAGSVQLYFTESMTFLVHTPEASVRITAG